MDFTEMNDNIISRRWEARYAELPEIIKERIIKLDTANLIEYQLQVIKKSRVYPQKGDIFKIKLSEKVELYGVVINNHISNMNGDELLVILIFRWNVDVKEIMQKGIGQEDILIPPEIVGKEYWTKGFFSTVDHCDSVRMNGHYGFYSLRKRTFVDEYGKEIGEEPSLLGTYGVATISGIARQVNRELIIAGII